MVHRILLAEDDVRLASLVKDYLESTGEYAVTVETNGGKVQRTVTDVLPELLILDVMLPNKDGLSICREIRPTFPGPILMLTARNDDADQILGLECGADDYVIKPAEPRVLLARIRALLRRYALEEKSDKENLQYGDLNICCLSRTVTFAGEPVDRDLLAAVDPPALELAPHGINRLRETCHLATEPDGRSRTPFANCRSANTVEVGTL